MRIAMIQMASASGDVERNISRAFSMMEEAAEKSDLLVLPELWTIGYNFHHFEEHILSRHAALLEKLSDFARTHRVTLSPGTLPIRHGGIIRNTGFLFAPDGKCIAEYSKRHLFQGYLEAKLFRPGDARRRGSMASRRGWLSVMSSISRRCGEKWQRPGRPSSLRPLPGRRSISSSGVSFPLPVPSRTASASAPSIWQVPIRMLSSADTPASSIPWGMSSLRRARARRSAMLSMTRKNIKISGKGSPSSPASCMGKIIDLCPAQNRIFFRKVRFFHARFHQPMRKICDTGVSFPVQAAWSALRGKIIFATIVVGSLDMDWSDIKELIWRFWSRCPF